MINNSIKAVLTFLLNQKCIGGKHIPEKMLLKSKTRWINNYERKEFYKQYKELLNNEIILRFKKQTGKSVDWHISLNPRKLKEAYEMM